MQRIFKHGSRRAGLHQFSMVHHTYSVTQKFDHIQIMRNKQERKTVLLLQMTEQIHNLCLY